MLVPSVRTAPSGARPGESVVARRQHVTEQATPHAPLQRIADTEPNA